MLTKNSVSHDTVPYFMERFRDAYTTQLQNFAQNVLRDRTPPITIEDGLEALLQSHLVRRQVEARKAAKALVGSGLDDAALKRAAEASSAAARPIDDKRGTTAYRRTIAGVLTRRAAAIAKQRVVS